MSSYETVTMRDCENGFHLLWILKGFLLTNHLQASLQHMLLL